MMTSVSLEGRDLLSIGAFSGEEITHLVNSAIRLKSSPVDRQALAGIGVAMLFEKPSLRTRASFEFGLAGLGANAVFFDLAPERIGQRESIKDYAMNLERWCHAIVARVYDHSVLEELARHSSVPVVNALSDQEHPCQALADLLTIRQVLGTLAGKKLAFVGDGNNVCRSLMHAAAAVGMHVTVVSPDGHAPRSDTVTLANEAGRDVGGSVRIAHELDAVRGHDVVYTDTWVSMGESPEKARQFSSFCVDEAVMSIASDGVSDGAVFMHCLPATRGAEVAAEVIDGPASVVYEQAENRMHAQNALMLALLGRG